MAETRTDITRFIAPSFGTTPPSYMHTRDDYMNVYVTLDIGRITAGNLDVDVRLVLYRYDHLPTQIASSSRIRRNNAGGTTINHQFSNIAKKNLPMKVVLEIYDPGTNSRRYSVSSPTWTR